MDKYFESYYSMLWWTWTGEEVLTWRRHPITTIQSHERARVLAMLSPLKVGREVTQTQWQLSLEWGLVGELWETTEGSLSLEHFDRGMWSLDSMWISCHWADASWGSPDNGSNIVERWRARFIGQVVREWVDPEAPWSRECWGFGVEGHANPTFLLPSLLPVKACCEGTAHCMAQPLTLQIFRY